MVVVPAEAGNNRRQIQIKIQICNYTMGEIKNEIIIVAIILIAALLYSKRGEWFGNNSIDITKKQAEAIAFYKREYENQSTKELIRKDNEEKLTDEASIAIDQILNERSANADNFMP